jgi:hypothetical protein
MSDIPADAQTGIDASIAAANAAEARGDHSARAAAATAALNAWSAAIRPPPPAEPTDAVGASARLAHLQKDRAWRDRYFAGDQQAVREFNSLNEKIAAADPYALAIAGHAPPDGVDENAGAVAGGREMVAAAAHLRDLGFSDGDIHELFNGQLTDDGKPLTIEEMRAGAKGAEHILQRAGRDPELRRRILSGDSLLNEQLTMLSAVIAAGKKGVP